MMRVNCYYTNRRRKPNSRSVAALRRHGPFAEMFARNVTKNFGDKTVVRNAIFLEFALNRPVSGPPLSTSSAQSGLHDATALYRPFVGSVASVFVNLRGDDNRKQQWSRDRSQIETASRYPARARCLSGQHPDT